MLKHILLSSVLMGSLSSCNVINEMNASIRCSTLAIHRNADAIEQSTRTVRINAQLVEESNQAIEENQRLLEAVR